jgi:hypothetical protein
MPTFALRLCTGVVLWVLAIVLQEQFVNAWPMVIIATYVGVSLFGNS